MGILMPSVFNCIRGAFAAVNLPYEAVSHNMTFESLQQFYSPTGQQKYVIARNYTQTEVDGSISMACVQVDIY
jgi:hypothetical protein